MREREREREREGGREGEREGERERFGWSECSKSTKIARYVQDRPHFNDAFL